MSEIKFPIMMESKSTGRKLTFVVEFISEYEGTVIANNNPSLFVGLYQDCWISCFDTNVWKPYTKQENKPMNTSTKEQALARLEAIEAEQKELRKLLEAPEKEEVVGSLIYSATQSCSGTNSFFLRSLDKKFQTPALADKYAEAFETFIKLRQQPGSVGANEEGQWLLEPRGENIIVEYWGSVNVKIKQLSPCFSTQEYAEAATKSVGEEAILQMMKTFNHYEGE